MKKPTVNTGTFFPTPTELFTVPQAGKVFLFLEGDPLLSPMPESLLVPGVKPYPTRGNEKVSFQGLTGFSVTVRGQKK
jgi:hypothetical protein